MSLLHVQEGLKRLERLIAFTERRQRLALDQSAARPLDVAEVQARYQDAVWVDTYLMPANRLLQGLQREPDSTAQLLHGLGMVRDAAADLVPGSGARTAAETLLAADDFTGALESAVPAFETFTQTAAANLEKWRQSETGLGSAPPPGFVAAPSGLGDAQDGREITPVVGTSPGAQSGAPPIVVLIDSSGSMKKTDPQDLRLKALARMLDLMPPSVRLGVIDFDAHAREINPLVELGPMAGERREALRKRIGQSPRRQGGRPGCGDPPAKTGRRLSRAAGAAGPDAQRGAGETCARPQLPGCPAG